MVCGNMSLKLLKTHKMKRPIIWWCEHEDLCVSPRAHVTQEGGGVGGVGEGGGGRILTHIFNPNLGGRGQADPWG